MEIPIYDPADLAARIDSLRRPWHAKYLAMYSSLYQGIVTDPVLMVVPADDHLVHRADGVFDVLKCVDGRAYRLRAHLDRLERSAAAIGLTMPADYERIHDIIRATVRAGGQPGVIVRIMVSRGPGGFTTNPYESPASQLYVLIYRLKTPASEEYERGVTIISAPIPVKQTFFANIKSCDYLANVLVKKAAVEAGVEFAVTWDENGYLAEGSTENIILVSPDRDLLIPDFERVLRGTTVARVVELAEALVDSGRLASVREARIDRKLAESCPEVMLCGTSLDVLPVRVWDGRTVGDGRPGPVAKALLELLRVDMTTNTALLTPIMD
ncbi:MAG: aminotransferase class IV [Proteobacteria bacterium]|nr:aminotransferase class IV [Pseudomonadota bacterium]